jgi:hypothetical protein
MSDRELLELAAKAAGMEYPNGQTYCETLGVWGMLEKRPYHWWNPLTDDGDALRLAVKLGLSLKHYYYEGDYFIKVPVNNVAMTEPLAADPYTATRRAIVRAAAEIGKGMK